MFVLSSRVPQIVTDTHPTNRARAGPLPLHVSRSSELAVHTIAPELMVPGGPEWACRYDYDQVRELYRGADGSGFRLVYFVDHNKTTTVNESYIFYEHGALDR